MGEVDGGRCGRGVTRAAVIGYGPDAREQAIRLRAHGWSVDVVVRSGGMTWVQAVADGFRPVAAAEAAMRADVVVVHLPESEQPAVWAYGLAPYLMPGALGRSSRTAAPCIRAPSIPIRASTSCS